MPLLCRSWGARVASAGRVSHPVGAFPAHPAPPFPGPFLGLDHGAPRTRLDRGRGTAMALTLSQAARSCGRGKTTLLRAVRSGRLSASRDETAGTWLIEPSELARVFPPETVHETANGAPRTERNGVDRTAVLEARIGEMIEAQRLRDDVIADLRE